MSIREVAGNGDFGQRFGWVLRTHPSVEGTTLRVFFQSFAFQEGKFGPCVRALKVAESGYLLVIENIVGLKVCSE